jgi:hypothetical protein
MVDARVVKVTFAITGEIEIRDFGDDYITFRNDGEMKRFDEKHAKSIIERNIKEKGLDAYEHRIQTKSRFMREDEIPQPVESGADEPPF